MMFPKPVRQPKEKKPYNSLQRKAKKDREIPEWKRDILSSHQSRPSAADRAEFPRKVIEQLIERAAGRCEVCGINPDAETHHVMPRGRRGRGVLQNGVRVCGQCHQRIQTNEDELQALIAKHNELYGPNFWYDDEDWAEYNRKQAEQREAAEERKQRLNELEPVINLLSTAAGRKLKAQEVRLLDNLGEREMTVFVGLMADIVKGQLDEPRKPVSMIGFFDD